MVAVNLTDDKLNPFPGLRPFRPGESDFFFGREDESAEVAEKLLRNRFVAVTGSTGSGKSSLVLCGVIPSIKRHAAAEGGKWNFIVTHPGKDPFRDITSALSGPDRDGKTLLFVDQLEEIFRYYNPHISDPSGYDAKEFINLLVSVANGSRPDIYLIVAIRSDMIYLCEHYRGFSDILNNSSFLVSPLSRTGICKAIKGPLDMAGVAIDDDLVELLANEVAESSEQLLLLQHAMLNTWNRWKRMNEPERPVDLSDYGSVDSMKDSISIHADEVYFGLDNNCRTICEKMFRIISGKSPDDKNIRYLSTFLDLKLSVPCNEEDLLKVMEGFRDPLFSFLNPPSAVPLTDETVIDLSHECLINLWDRLKYWTGEEAASVQVYLRLSEASALYQQGRAGLLKEPDLQAAISWRDNNNPTSGWARKYDPAFERAMVYLRTSEREYNESEARRSRREKWRLHRVRIISSVLGIIAIVAAVAMLGSLISKISSDNRRKQVEQQNLIIESQKKAAEQFAATALKRSVESDSNAVSASRREQMERMLRRNAENQVLSSKTVADEAIRESRHATQASLLAMMNADSALKAGNETQRLRMISVAKTMSLRSQQADINGDLQALLALQAHLFNKRNNGNRNDADIYTGLYTLAKNRKSDKIKVFEEVSGTVRNILFIPDRNEFIASDNEGRVMLYDLKNQGREKNYRLLYTDTEIVEVMAVSPDAGWLACGDGSNSVKMISLDGRGTNYELKGHSGKIKSLVFSFDGSFLYSAALDGKVLKWNLASGNSVELETDRTIITSLDVSSDNRYVAGVTDRGEGVVWNQGNTAGKFRIETANKRIRCIRFKPNEARIAVGYDDGLIEIWDVTAGKMMSEFRAHSGEIKDIRFNRYYEQMATSGDDETLKLWDTGDFINPPVCFKDNEGIVVGFEFSPNGEVIFSGSIGTKARIISRPAYADSFAADGCFYVTRNFTPDEWLAYVGRDITYEKTCPEAEFRIKIREIR